MRILLVSSWYPPIVAGSALWTESLADSLRKRGHDVRILTTQWKNIQTNKQRNEIVYELPAWTLPKNPFVLGLSIVPVSVSVANLNRFRKIIRDFKPDIIHQINHIFDTVLLSAYISQQYNIPLVGSMTTPIQSSSPLKNSFMKLIDRRVVYSYGVKYWCRIICSDSAHVKYVLNHYGEKVRSKIVSNIHTGVHQRIQNKNYKIKFQSPTIVSIGHIHPARNPINLIRAMPIVLKEIPEAKLILAGRIQFNEPINEVERLVLKSSVRFLGEIQPEDVSKLISKAHVFAILHFIRYDQLSFTSIEAMYHKTPVLINVPEDLYGKDVLKDEENIMIVNKNNIQEISQKLIKLLKNNALREKIGLNGKKFVDSYLNWDVCAEKTEQLYKEII